MDEPVPVPDDGLADLTDEEQVAMLVETDNSFAPEEDDVSDP